MAWIEGEESEQAMTKNRITIVRKPVKRKKSVIVSGVKRIEIEEEFRVRNPRHAAELFRKKHGIPPEYLGTRLVIGFDEGSGKVILEGDKYASDGGEGCLTLLQARDGRGKPIKA